MALTLAFRPGDLGWMLLVGGADAGGQTARPLGNGMPGNDLLNALAYNVLQFGVPTVLLLRLADALVDGRRLPAWVAYPLVVLTTVIGGVWLIAPALYPVLGKVDWWTDAANYSLASTTFVWHALGVAVYVQLRFSLRAQVRLEALQDAAAQRERRLAAAQLLALQARVDPALLSERLAVIDDELSSQPVRAQARLAALIELLRALQPHVEAEVSTLAREIVALRSYARLLSTDAQHTPSGCIWPAWPSPRTGRWRRWCCCRWCARCWTKARGLWSLSLHAGIGIAELHLQAPGPRPRAHPSAPPSACRCPNWPSACAPCTGHSPGWSWLPKNSRCSSSSGPYRRGHAS